MWAYAGSKKKKKMEATQVVGCFFLSEILGKHKRRLSTAWDNPAPPPSVCLTLPSLGS